MAKRCCGTSVGVIIEDADRWLLMIERGWWPIGTAPVAGHVYDAHADAAEAATAEVAEEVGLTITSKTLVWEGHLPNLCASEPAEPPGHYWWLYRAGATGTLLPAADETRGAGWYAPSQVADMAAATVAHARTSRDAADLPADALEAVWVAHLAAVGYLTPAQADLDAVARLFTTPPPAYYLGGRP